MLLTFILLILLTSILLVRYVTSFCHLDQLFMSSGHHVAILGQRMRGVFVEDVSALPLLSIHPVLTDTLEGSIVGYVVRRSRNMGGDVDFSYTFSSSGDIGDFPPGSVLSLETTIPSGTPELSVYISTAVRSGTQGDRDIRCDIVALVNGEVDPSRSFAVTTIHDRVEGDPNWFKTLPYRSDQPFAAGVAYFENDLNSWSQYEAECNFVDSFHGDHFGVDDIYVQTWDQVQGGPLGSPANILNNGQLGWNSIRSSFSGPFNEIVENKAWVFHKFTVVPNALSTTSGLAGAQSAIWDQIIAGVHDQRFREFGQRIAALFASRGYDLDYYIGCMCAKPQTSSVFRVFGATKLKFKEASDRVYEQMRIGSGNPLLRFCFSPTNHRTYDLEDYGDLGSWMPETCDVIGMSFHPDGFCTNEAKFTDLMNGTSHFYGLVGDLVKLATNVAKPIALFEWSPRWQTCPIANDVYGWLYNRFLLPYSDIIIAANVYHNNTFNPNAADGQSPAAAEQWAQGVSTFKNLFGTGETIPLALIRVTNETVGPVIEGNPITFNISRNSLNTQACSINWSVSSSGGSGDLTGAVSGTVTFDGTSPPDSSVRVIHKQANKVVRLVPGLTGAGTSGGEPYGQQTRPKLPPGDDYYLDYQVKFGLPLDWSTAHYGATSPENSFKIPGLGCQNYSGTSPDPTSNCGPVAANGWSARCVVEPFGEITEYLYHQTRTATCGQKAFLLKPGTSERFRFVKDRWYRMTIRTKINTPGAADGIWQIYIDGILIRDVRNQKWRGGVATSVARVDAFFWHCFSGGTDPSNSPAIESFVNFSNLYIIDVLPDFTRPFAYYDTTGG